MPRHQPSTDWVSVLQPLDMVQAQIVAARLDDVGISAYVREEGYHRAIPIDFGMIGRIDIMVPQDQEEAALQVLIDLGILEEIDEDKSE